MARTAYLLTNLGSPDSTSTKDIRRYLNEFLMDERVIDMPKLKRTLLVKGIIVPFRAPKTAEKYKRIWTEKGSPLIILSQALREAVADRCDFPVYLSMRYGKPNARTTLQAIARENPDLKHLKILPLYPHYAMSSFETAVEQVNEEFSALNTQAQLSTVKPFYDHPEYIQALAKTLAGPLSEDHDHVLFSYHGIPERHVDMTEPEAKHCLSSETCRQFSVEPKGTNYVHHVTRTTQLVAAACGIPKDKYSIAYQSRLGNDKWLTPNTAEVLQELPKKGVKRLIVICPSFVSDCLETLEEIDIDGRGSFLGSGGSDFQYIPCLNLSEDWVSTICALLEARTPELSASNN